MFSLQVQEPFKPICLPSPVFLSFRCHPIKNFRCTPPSQSNTEASRFLSNSPFLPCESALPRGDKTAIELFVSGVRDWEAALRRTFCVKSGGDPQS